MSGFLVDENLPARLAEELSSRGFPSRHVSDVPSLRTAPDDEIVAYAAREGLVIITKDKELSFVTRVPEVSRTGVVCVRISERLPIDAQVLVVVSAIASIDQREFSGSIIVVEPGRVRVRRGK
jgi:predicted nuclease of predicted toxin-antitoxin system